MRTASELGSPCEQSIILAGRELIEIVNSNCLLKLRHALSHFFKAILAEELMLLLFELFRHRVVFVRRHQALELGEEIGVLACGMGSIHDDERLHSTDQ